MVTLAHSGSLKKKELTLVMERVGQIGNDEVDMKFGISIDESMGEDLRVTVVATGLGSKAAAAADRQREAEENRKVVNINQPRNEPAIPPLIGPADIDYETPAINRERKVANGGSSAPSWLNQLDESVLNIPTFLRQQAD